MRHVQEYPWTVTALFLASFFFFLYLTYPGVAPRDSGELVTGSYHLGIVHSPGYPLYLLKGKLASVLIPFGTPAYRANVLNGLCTALSVMLFFCIVQRQRTSTRMPALVAAGLCVAVMINPVIIRQAIQAEVFALNTLFYLFILNIISLSIDLPPEKKIRLFYLTSFLFGLGIGNQHTLVLAVPVILYAFKDVFSVQVRQRIFTALLCILAGLAVYLYIPIRSYRDPVLDIGNGQTVSGMIKIFFRINYGTFTLSRTVSSNIFAHTFGHIGELIRSTGPVALLLSITGIITGVRKSRYVRILFLLWLLTGPLFIAIARMPRGLEQTQILGRFFPVPVIALLLLSWYGLSFMYHRLGRARMLIISCIICVLLWPSGFFITENNRRQCFIPYDYGIDILHSIKPPALLFVVGDTTNSVLHYLLYVIRKRTDVHLIFPGKSAWFKEQLKTRHPDIVSSLTLVDGFLLGEQLAQANASDYHAYTTDARFFTYKHPLGLVMERTEPGAAHERLTLPYVFHKRSFTYPPWDFFLNEILDHYPVKKRVYHRPL